jgi:hypothetical protein
MKTYVRLWQKLAELSLEREVIQTDIVEIIKGHILYSKNFFRKSFLLRDNVKKNMVEPSSPQMKIRPKRIACWVPNDTDTHSHCALIITFSQQQ